MGTKQKVLKSGTIVGKVRFYVSAFTSDACGTKIAFAHRIFPIRNRTIGETLFKARDTKNNKYVFLHLRKKRENKAVAFVNRTHVSARPLETEWETDISGLARR